MSNDNQYQPTPFYTPATQQDFKVPSQQEEMNALWNQNVNGYTQTSIVGDPWNVENDHDRSSYYNALDTQITGNVIIAPVTWNAFPARLTAYYQGLGGGLQEGKNPYELSDAQINRLADQGFLANVVAFEKGLPNIPTDICPKLNWNQPTKDWQTWAPTGPRGWQDEYCEWFVTRGDDPSNPAQYKKIIRVDFTCENPEYWFTLWAVDPEEVLSLYRSILGKNNIELDDLYLKDKNNNIINNPTTDRPAYDPLNKWNRGTVSSTTQGGAVHLTSPPNTIGAEIYLGAAATILRQLPADKYTPQGMNCCSKYGQSFRNSDPHIGFTVNELVKGQKVRVALANPIGLYLQQPDSFNNWSAPAGKKAEDYWTVTRGLTKDQTPPAYGKQYDWILHATYAIPEGVDFSVEDFAINSEAITTGAQIVNQLHIALAAAAYQPTPVPTPKTFPCPTATSIEDQQPQITAFMSNGMLKGYNDRNGGIVPPVNAPNFVLGQSYPKMAILCINNDPNALKPEGWPSFEVPGNADITFNVTQAWQISGPPPGQSTDATSIVYVVNVGVAATATVGQYGLTATKPGTSSSTPAPCMLVVKQA